MNGKKFKQTLKTWMLPIAMLGGILCHNIMGYLSPLSPYLIGIMLFITYCKLNPREIRVSKSSLFLLAVEIGGSVALYLAIRPFNEILAQAAFICVFCPTATAAPVITGMLGGSISKLAAFSLVSNFTVALLAPVFFSLIGAHGHEESFSFLHVTFLISLKVVPIILGPLALALILEWISPKAHDALGKQQDISFYVWAVSLFIVVGNAVTYVMKHLRETPEEGMLMLAIALVSLIVCCLQFVIGRRIGRIFGDKISGAQGLGQKNTVLAIWMSLTFLNPLSSVGPAAYVAWQNTINSAQLWYKQKRDSRTTT